MCAWAVSFVKRVDDEEVVKAVEKMWRDKVKVEKERVCAFERKWECRGFHTGDCGRTKACAKYGTKAMKCKLQHEGCAQCDDSETGDKEKERRRGCYEMGREHASVLFRFVGMGTGILVVVIVTDVVVSCFL